MNKYKKKGFTLVEVIFSIALLSIVSVVILNLYLTSGELNKRAQEKNMATLMASNSIEVLKVESSLPEEDSIIYYNEYWEEVSTPSEALYTMTVKTSYNTSTKALVDIQVQVMTSADEPLVSINTAHFTPSGGGK